MSKATCPPRIRTRARAAFTLIELMIVVAIIGVLASLALPVFRSVLFRSRTAEVPGNLNALFKGAAAYYAAERGAKGQTGTMSVGCVVGDSGPQPATPRSQKQRVPGNNDQFRAIGFSVGDYAYFSYGIASKPSVGATGQCGGTRNDNAVYTMYANGDLDADGTLSVFELAVGSDGDNQLYHGRGMSIANEVE